MVLAVVAFLGYGAYGVFSSDNRTTAEKHADWEADLVRDHCSYGAVSQGQLDGCEDHVPADDVFQRDTNAARYARSDLARCLADAGPFCVGR